MVPQYFITITCMYDWFVYLNHTMLYPQGNFVELELQASLFSHLGWNNFILKMLNFENAFVFHFSRFSFLYAWCWPCSQSTSNAGSTFGCSMPSSHMGPPSCSCSPTSTSMPTSRKNVCRRQMSQGRIRVGNNRIALRPGRLRMVPWATDTSQRKQKTVWSSMVNPTARSTSDFCQH